MTDHRKMIKNKKKGKNKKLKEERRTEESNLKTKIISNVLKEIGLDLVENKRNSTSIDTE